MSLSRFKRLCCYCLLMMPVMPSAASHLEIRIGEIHHPQAQLENVVATLDADGNWYGSANIKQTDLNQLAPNLPVKFSKGSLQGKLAFAGKDNQPQQIKADLNLRDTAFSNIEGSKAADKLAGNFNIKAQRKDAAWAWKAALNWRDGELFWQPLYFANGGHALEASGQWSEDKLTVTQGLMSIASVGAVKFNGELALPSNSITRLDIDAKNLALDNAYALLIKPFMEKSVLGDLEAAGRADLSA
ncbi:MAG: hypothetical protein K8Q92_02510, partial [Methylophilales bacterium]|nr:hypothetical protein [Methylophilales bacterium]